MGTKKLNKTLDKITISDNIVKSSDDITNLRKEINEIISIWNSNNQDLIKSLKLLNNKKKDVNFFKLTKIKRDLQKIIEITTNLNEDFK
jgi:hypothetical protein